MVDEQRGLAALREFYNYAVLTLGSKFPYQNFDLFYSAVKKTKGAGVYFADGFGFGINTIGLSDAKVRSAMHALVDQGGGKLPSLGSGWFNAIANEGAKIDFMNATVFVATESAKDVVNGAVAVGDAVVDTGKSLLAVGPLALTAAALAFLYFQVMKTK